MYLNITLLEPIWSYQLHTWCFYYVVPGTFQVGNKKILKVPGTLQVGYKITLKVPGTLQEGNNITLKFTGR